MTRIDVALVAGGKWHDFDYARLQLLQALSHDERIRVHVAPDYNDARLLGAQALISYTCDLRPPPAVQQAWHHLVERGGRWLALHGSNAAIDPPTRLGIDTFTSPRVFPLWVDTLGSQFVAHPPWRRYTVTTSPGAEGDPLVAGIGSFETGEDELYLCEYHGDIVPLLETRFSGSTGAPGGFAEHDWPDDKPRLVLYRRPLGKGEVVYFSLAHCSSRWDLIDPPFDKFPREHLPVGRGSWEVPEYREILRRAINWVTATES
jgi:type 1 glutamine amidotransferase